MLQRMIESIEFKCEWHNELLNVNLNFTCSIIGGTRHAKSNNCCVCRGCECGCSENEEACRTGPETKTFPTNAFGQLKWRKGITNYKPDKGWVYDALALQYILNSVAELAGGIPQLPPIPIFIRYSLHWLPIQKRKQFKILSLSAPKLTFVHACIHTCTYTFKSEFMHSYEFARILYS